MPVSKCRFFKFLDNYFFHNDQIFRVITVIFTENGYPFRGGNSLKIVLPPSERCLLYKEREQILSFQSRPLSEKDWYKEKQTESYKSLL